MTGTANALDQVGSLADWDIILINTSGGKDSQVMLDVVAKLAAEAGVSDRVVALHCNLGEVEWPGTAELAAEQVAHYGLRFELRHREQGDLLDQVWMRGMWPDSRARYCTSDQKRGPARKLITQLVAELGPLGRPARVLNCMGLRAAESTGRALKAPFSADNPASNGKREVFTWLPIHDWSDEQVWARIRETGVRYHQAYDDGMTRLSCSFCVLASHGDLLRACRLRPELADRYAKLEAEIGHRFTHARSMAELIAEARGATS